MEVPRDEIQPGAAFDGVDFSGEDFSGGDLSGVSFVNCDLSGADLSGADLSGADLTDSRLSNTLLFEADLSDAVLSGVTFRDVVAEKADFTDASLVEADFTGADLRRADFGSADLWRAEVAEANASLASFTDSILVSVSFDSADIEEAAFNGANLIRADLSTARYYGSVFTDAQIDHTTTFGSHCVYDPDCDDALPISDVYDPQSPSSYVESSGEDEPSVSVCEMERSRLNKAASSYRSTERLARENALPELQRRMYVRGRDVHRRRYRHGALEASTWSDTAGMAFDFGFGTVSRSVFLYGESLWRIVAWSGLIVALFAFLYVLVPELSVAEASRQASGPGLTDSMLFSTRVFVSGGSTEAYSESPLLQLLVTIESIIGGLLFALFVFVLGRRAAR